MRPRVNGGARASSGRAETQLRGGRPAYGTNADAMTKRTTPRDYAASKAGGGKSMLE